MNSTATLGKGRGAAENGHSERAFYTASAAEPQQSPTDPASWQRGSRWRLLPWSRAIVAGPLGHCEYLCSRDRHMIAYRNHAGRWLPGTGENLTGCTVYPGTWDMVWPVPSRCACRPARGRCLGFRIHRDLPDGEQFAPCDPPLVDVLERCARHPATAWILTGEDVR